LYLGWDYQSAASCSRNFDLSDLRRTARKNTGWWIRLHVLPTARGNRQRRRSGARFNAGRFPELDLALMQHLAGDTAGAKVTAEQARNIFEQLHRDQPEKSGWAAWLSLAYAVMGEKDSALKLAERAIVLVPRPKDQIPRREENVALIQMIFGENSRAISTLSQLLQTPYGGWLYSPTPITPALYGSIRSGTHCAAIRLSKSSARKSRRETMLGNYRRQSQQSRLEFGLGLSRGFYRANNLRC
jgi:hypothetical protein